MCSYSYIKVIASRCCNILQKNPRAEQELLITEVVMDRNRTT